MIEPKPPLSVFLSYAQKDEALKQEFEDYLAAMQDAQIISGWVERQVQRGTDWSQTIDPRLLAADLFLLLVSPALLASGYCSGAELHAAFEKSNKSPREAVLIPILLHPVSLAGSPFQYLQPLPMRRPVSSWRVRREAWADVDHGIRVVITHMRQPPV